jgi:hypothetical protein
MKAMNMFIERIRKALLRSLINKDEDDPLTISMRSRGRITCILMNISYHYGTFHFQ